MWGTRAQDAGTARVAIFRLVLIAFAGTALPASERASKGGGGSGADWHGGRRRIAVAQVRIIIIFIEPEQGRVQARTRYGGKKAPPVRCAGLCAKVLARGSGRAR